VANNNQIYKFSNAGGFKSLNRYYDMLAGNTTWNPWEPDGAYDSLATVTVGATSVASIEFAGIPNTYKHLQLRMFARTSRASSNGDYAVMRFNGINSTASYYSQHYLYGNGTSAVAGADGTFTGIYIERLAAASQTSGVFGASIVDILDYADTNKNKVIRNFNGLEDNSGTAQSRVTLGSGMLLSTPAINSIVLTSGTGSNFVQYSQFSLYGVK
jgi:hypothetical protein